jgi:LPS sulfotransferase NodH
MIELTPDTPLAPIHKKTLIIAMTERCGSTNLCSILTKLGLFGKVDEFFNPNDVMPYYGLQFAATDAADYLAKLAQQAEVFCFKISGLNWRPFAKRAKAVFPNARYVYLDRLDLDAQAVSLYRARGTSIWHATDATNASSTLDLDPAEVEACRQHLLIGKAKWSQFFFEADIKPLTIMYEHMLADMPKAVQMICGEAGLLVFKNKVPSGDYRILRDHQSEGWKEELRSLRVGASTPDQAG